MQFQSLPTTNLLLVSGELNLKVVVSWRPYLSEFDQEEMASTEASKFSAQN